MIVQAIQGRDITIDADDYVILRIQNNQWRFDAPDSGTLTIDGSHTRNLSYYGNRSITGDLWIGKSWHAIHVDPRG